jgi:hypothetical protein
MAKLWVGPTGRLSKGHVLDVAEKPFERALKDYDSQLYVHWNPKKLRNHGCWEIRRRPDRKEIVDYAIHNGNAYLKIDYLENDLINHVLDAAFLNYDALRKIKEMDTTVGNQKYWVDQLEAKEAEHRAKIETEAKESRRLYAREFKREIKDFKEMILSGFNPHLIADHWNK